VRRVDRPVTQRRDCVASGDDVISGPFPRSEQLGQLRAALGAADPGTAVTGIGPAIDDDVDRGRVDRGAVLLGLGPQQQTLAAVGGQGDAVAGIAAALVGEALPGPVEEQAVGTVVEAQQQVVASGERGDADR
jgi:hypothetical protein